MPQHDLVVIGAGPGGYVAAIRAAQLGLNVACIEQEPALGGTCLRVGCIPSKALLESSELYAEARQNFGRHGIILSSVELDLKAMLRRKDQVVTALTKGVDSLFKKNKITRYLGHGRVTSSSGVTVESKEGVTELSARHILIATGSKPSSLPGIQIDHDRIVTSTEALSFNEVPKRLILIGAGYIGLELGSVWNRLGSKVIVLEYLNRILPGMDSEIAADAQKLFEKQGLDFKLGRRVHAVRLDGSEAVVEAEGDEPIRADKVLMAVGRIPNTDELGLEKVGVKIDQRGRIEVGKNFKTSVAGIFAIGDVIAGPMLAHKAEEEGIACIEALVTGYGHGVNYETIPGIVYTHPENCHCGVNRKIN